MFLLLLLAADPVTTLKYVRPAKDKFVLESKITEAKSKTGSTFTSVTDRGSEKMTLSLFFDVKGALTRAEALQETAKGKQSITATFTDKEAIVARGKTTVRLKATSSAIVTTAPDWSDIFQVIRRYDRDKGGKQSFAGLWIHPVKESRQLTFTVEPLKDDEIMDGDKKVSLKRYKVTLRSGAYLVWADKTGKMYRLMPPGKPGGAVILEGYEKATKDLK